MTRPIIAIIGTTGSGKSQFAVDLAHSLPSPCPAGSTPETAIVLSADSMQLYEGLPVITNKVTEEEMEGVEHWGLGVVRPGEGGSWEVGRWIYEAKRKIAELPLSTLPIICGGTHYYTQHLLFPPTHLHTARPSSPDPTTAPRNLRWTPPAPHPPLPANFPAEYLPLLNTFYLPNPVFPATPSAPSVKVHPTPPIPTRPTLTDAQSLLHLHTLLTHLDPAEARRWHWRDGRKVRRGVERWWEGGVGVAPVEAVETAEAGEDGAEEGKEEGFRTLIFWVYEEPETLMPRLDKRVDRMVDLGLLEEIIELRKEGIRIYGSEDAIDCEEGIFQSIGYKEFSSIPTSLLTPTHPLFPPLLERMKLSTRQYAKKQLKWIKKQLLPVVRDARAKGGEVAVYVVRAGEGKGLGGEVMRAFLRGEPLPDARSVGHPAATDLLRVLYETTVVGGEEGTPTVLDIQQRQIANSRRVCEVCSVEGEPFSVGEVEWEAHLRSKVHRKAQRGRDIAEGKISYDQVREEAALRKAEKEKAAEKAKTGDVAAGRDGDGFDGGSTSL